MKKKVTTENNLQGVIVRVLIFIFLSAFTELLLWKKLTFAFQIKFNLIMMALWIPIVELIMSYKRYFRLHRQNYWGAFMLPLILNIVINLFIFKYLNIFGLTTILSTLIISMLIDFESGVLSAFVFSTFFGLLFGFDFRYTIILFIPGVLIAFISQKITRRIEIFFPFLLGSFLQTFLLYIFGYSRNTLDFIIIVGVNFMGILVSMGILPFIEYITRVYSDIGLLELGNLNHPLLRELSMKAPGTYYHSMLVANMLDSSVEYIGGRTVLARIGAYFHDIGKTWKPLFFTENQKDENPHDKLSPKLSSLVLDYHVRYGQEMAKKYRLPILIEDMIVQHQGTRVKQYFYKKYMETTGNKNPELFRYPGPVPQFKEAALLMLCDITEAYARTLKDLTPAKLSESIDNFLQSLYFEGQLDECGLTVKELKKIKGTIIRTILAMNHKRITYPKLDEKDIKR